MSTNQVTRAAMSTGVSKTFDYDQTENARAWALREAQMLVARNEPNHLGTAYARPSDYTGKPVELYALAEALAAFVVADIA